MQESPVQNRHSPKEALRELIHSGWMVRREEAVGLTSDLEGKTDEGVEGLVFSLGSFVPVRTINIGCLADGERLAYLEEDEFGTPTSMVEGYLLSNQSPIRNVGWQHSAM